MAASDALGEGADLPGSVADTAALLAAQGYIADLELSTTVHLALAMRRPLFLEGEPGTGKTEIAKVLAAGLRRRLVRQETVIAKAEGKEIGRRSPSGVGAASGRVGHQY